MALTKATYAMIDGDTANVKDYGAVGDGVTDDTQAIYNALHSGMKSVFLSDGSYFLSPTTMQGLPFNGLTVPTGVKFYGSPGASLLLQSGGDYSHVVIVDQNATDVLIDGIIIEGNDAYSNGIVLSGLGGTTANDNCFANNCIVKNVISELVVRSVAQGGLYQREGGCAYVMELNGSGGLMGCSAIGCQFGIRYAPGAGEKNYYTINNFYAEGCESILNTTPSNFDNRDYAQNASYSVIMRQGLVVDGLTFKNCGASSNARTSLSFSWVDTSGENGGRATGNYYPWAGIRRTAAPSTYEGLNWAAETFNAADTEWNSASTYSAGNRVKVTNNSQLGALFCFGRVGGVTISNVRGWNDHFTGVYPKIGALFRGIMRGVSISNVHVDVSAKSIVHFGTAPSTTWDLQPFMICQYVFVDNVFNIGPSDNVCTSDMPWNGNWYTSFGSTISVNYQKNVQYVYLTNIRARGVSVEIVAPSLKTEAPAEVVTFDDQTFLQYVNVATNATRSGKFSEFASALSNFADTGIVSENLRGYFSADDAMYYGSAGQFLSSGAGSPESVVTAPVGSLYLRNDGSTSTTLYVKTSGTGNTGWTAK